LEVGEDHIRAHSLTETSRYSYENRSAAIGVSRPNSLWNLRGMSIRGIATRSWQALLADRIFGHAAELGFYFLFALFPTLFSASSILGLAPARRLASTITFSITSRFSFPPRHSALFCTPSTKPPPHPHPESSPSASSLQSGPPLLVFPRSRTRLTPSTEIEDSRSYFKARIYAIGLTILLTVIVTLGLSALFAAIWARA